MKVTLNYKNALSFVSEEALNQNKENVLKAYKTLVNKTGEGNDFLGWIEYPKNYDKEEFARIKKAAEKIRSNSEVLVVIGIGGSYLGAKAVIEALKPYFSTKKDLEIVFAGNSLSSTYLNQLLTYLENKDFSVNVISKSGTTTEPAIAFRLCKELLIKKYHEKAAERIFATTDAKKGALRNLATQEGYETFVVPDDIGGRYSWFTAVGLLPIACAGIDIDALMKGSYDAMNDCVNNGYDSNDAMKYANMRNLLYKTKQIEILVNFEPRLAYISEWWKQLYGESEGKDHKGLFPASLVYSTDLHSMGQYVPHPPKAALCRLAHIRIDQEHLFAQHCIANGNVGCCQALALRGLCASDGEARTWALLIRRHAEHQTGAQLYIGFLYRKWRFIGQQTFPVCTNSFNRYLSAFFLFRHRALHLPPPASSSQHSHLSHGCPVSDQGQSHRRTFQCPPAGRWSYRPSFAE